MSEDLESQDHTVSNPGEGVGGWLLVLCIVMVVVSPLLGAHNMFSHFQQASSSFEFVAGLQPYLFVLLAIRIFLIMFSMYDGICLWTERPKAVKIAKAFLWTVFVSLIVGVVLAFVMVKWPPDKMSYVYWDIGIEVAETMTFVLACYLYLLKSTRVKNTYYL